ncbi:hypothetical protein CASFOL_030128 [Castilleja foliolosa]|uniref:DUF7731 domain-containing protein n=1 Tax=Castilleja foliolosa TaxID=1961234 RepID=A0ABD3CAG1_9LAMI
MFDSGFQESQSRPNSNFCSIADFFPMRKLSSIASRVAPEIENLADNFNSPKETQIPKTSIVKLHDQKSPNKISSTGKVELKNLVSVSISTPKAHISAGEQMVSSKPIDRHYFAEILSRKDWYLILNHEFQARSFNLNTQVAVSIFQNQENALSALRFYVWLSSFNPSLAKNKSISSALSNALYRKGPILLSAELIHEIKNSGCRLNEELLCALIGSWGRLGLAKYCSDVFEQVSFLGIVPSTRLYNAVIDGLVKSNSLDLAYLKFHQMEVDNCKRDRFTYNILIHGVCKAGVVDEAHRLVKQMESLGYFPNVFTYTILMDGYFSSKKIDEAFRVLEKMKTRNVRPNDATYRTLINGVFRNLSPLEAFELLLRWVNNKLNLPKVVYESIVYSLCENSLPKQVVTFLRISNERGYVPDSSISNIVITCLVKGLFDLDETCQIFEYMIERGVKVDLSTCLALIGNLYKSRSEENGNKYLNWIIEKGLVTNVFSYNMVIDCFCKANMMDKAIEMFQMMSKMGIFPNLVTFNTLIAGYSRNRDVIKAREMLLMLLDRGFKPDVYTFSSIIEVLCQSNQIVDAFDCFVEMVEWGINPNAVTYNSLIRSLCVSGNIFKATKLLRKMQVDGIKPEVYTFNALIQNCCKFNKIEKAQRLLVSMLSLDLRPDNYTYVAFINCLCESGRFVEAKDLFDSMEENGCGPDAYTCDSFVDALVKLGRFREAKDVWLKYKEKGVTLKPMAVSRKAFEYEYPHLGAADVIANEYLPKAEVEGENNQFSPQSGIIGTSPIFSEALGCFSDKRIYSSCNEARRLTQSGELNIPPEYADEYCNGACLSETSRVLDCLGGILKGFVFYNRATLRDVRETIESGCGYGPKRGNFDVLQHIQSDDASKNKASKAVVYVLVLMIIGWRLLVI